VLLILFGKKITMLYGELLRAGFSPNVARREGAASGPAMRYRLSMAHEIQQTIVGDYYVRQCQACAGLIARRPDLDEAQSRITANRDPGGHRARRADREYSGALQEGWADPGTSLDVKPILSAKALALVHDDLQTHRIAVQADYDQRFPRIEGNRGCSCSRCW